MKTVEVVVIRIRQRKPKFNQMYPVDSSAIHSLGYDSRTRTARVKFLNGKVYDYLAIAGETFLAWLNARSVGQFYNFVIKGGPRLAVAAQ